MKTQLFGLGTELGKRDKFNKFLVQVKGEVQNETLMFESEPYVFDHIQNDKKESV